MPAQQSCAMFGPGHRAIIHDGDGCVLFGRLSGHDCAGTVSGLRGETVATFAIDYVLKEQQDGGCLRRVVGIHLGPRGYWCRSIADADAFDRWINDLSQSYATVTDPETSSSQV